MPEFIEIVEVSARDGLQNEALVFPTASKLELIRRSLDAGVKRLEVASFVHPRLVPQMADAEALCAELENRDDVTYIGLILNRRGLERAIETEKLQEVGCVAVASDGFGLKNQGQGVKESIRMANDLVTGAREAGMSAQVTISVAFGCPFDGEVDQAAVVDVATQLAESQPREIALADTIGVAAPSQVRDVIGAVAEAVGSEIPLRAHFHNTRNTGIANAYAACEAGVRILDSSIGGVGGCPFAPRATGNIATEDLLYMLQRMDYETGLDLERVIHAAGWLGSELHRPVPGMLSRAGTFPT
jgi:hydroxymethylglutaryl-CoA lyase